MSEPIDIYADSNEPTPVYWGRIYLLRLTHEQTGRDQATSIWVNVDTYDELSVEKGTWLGEPVDRQNWAQVREILDWLVEWEYAEWRRIGPEDSEVFATEKLLSLEVAS